jgi:hypothetical protein
MLLLRLLLPLHDVLLLLLLLLLYREVRIAADAAAVGPTACDTAAMVAAPYLTAGASAASDVGMPLLGAQQKKALHLFAIAPHALLCTHNAHRNF